jgi:hypothetical protein
MTNDVCDLGSSGFTHTSTAVYEWAQRICRLIRGELGDGPITARVWAYRYEGNEHLSADFFNEAGSAFPLTFIIGRQHQLDTSDPLVPDMVEAIHMCGILTGALQATVQLGRQCNETNPMCTPEQWKPGQTNGRLKVIVSA